MLSIGAEEENRMQIQIVRDNTMSDDNGTFGAMSIDGVFFCKTCEQPWNDNLQDKSCIPAGIYELRAYESPAHGPTVVFHNPDLGVYATPNLVPAGASGRSLCEVHPANWPSQLKGCVAVGEVIADLPPNGTGITNSRATFSALENKWGDRTGLTALISWATATAGV